MKPKLTPELSQALDRAIDAAASDPLVEALEALGDILLDMAANESNGLSVKRARKRASVSRARAVLAKYRPALSDSDTLKS